MRAEPACQLGMGLDQHPTVRIGVGLSEDGDESGSGLRRGGSPSLPRGEEGKATQEEGGYVGQNSGVGHPLPARSLGDGMEAGVALRHDDRVRPLGVGRRSSEICKKRYPGTLLGQKIGATQREGSLLKVNIFYELYIFITQPRTLTFLHPPICPRTTPLPGLPTLLNRRPPPGKSRL